MNTYKMFFSGFGGQGVMLAGQMVAKAAITEGRETTFFPSYGPEMRGGTANCTVIVSDKPISSPLIYESDYVMAMNAPSMLKFEPTLKPGGMLFINTSLIHQEPKRDDIAIHRIAANDLAHDLGNARTINMIMLGAFVRATGIVSEETMEKVISDMFGAKKPELAELNLKAFRLVE